jgi:hypothetical protein
MAKSQVVLSLKHILLQRRLKHDFAISSDVSRIIKFIKWCKSSSLLFQSIEICSRAFNQCRWLGLCSASQKAGK